jgi:hypothetical protein
VRKIAIQEESTEWIPKMGTAVLGLFGRTEPGFDIVDIRTGIGEEVVFPLLFEKIEDMPAV